MRAFAALSWVVALALFVLTAPAPARAKGNDVWVLTGGALGQSARGGVEVDLVDVPDGAQVVAPPAAPGPGYDLYNSYGDFAVPQQMWQGGGAWVRYYPQAGLFEFQDVTPHTWHRFPPDIRATVDSAIARALAEKRAGTLPASAAAADFAQRDLDRMAYRISPYNVGGPSPAAATFYPADGGDYQIHGAASEHFVMQALVDTVSRPPAGATLDAPWYEITLSGTVSNGVGVGGPLGYYTPPDSMHAGRFWDDNYWYDKRTPYYVTTPQFDAIIAAALAPKRAEDAPASLAVAPRGHARSLVAAAIAGVLLLALIGGATAIARVRSS